MKPLGEIGKGLFKENPILVIMLGLCATLACSTNFSDALGMGLAFSFVIVGSNVVISLVRRLVPGQVRIPVYITVIATLVTVADYVMKAFVPDLSRSLGVFVPLIVVNCIIMGRAEAFASKNGVWRSFLDGLGMGIGFTVVIALIGILRGLMGEGTISLSLLGLKDITVLSDKWYPGVLIFILAPGAFLVIGFLIALHHKIGDLLATAKARKTQSNLRQAATASPTVSGEGASTDDRQ
ncbi:MAG: electron transport complex subunit E [Spirochaetales bacterium]|nr:electron transport complex subunit E [Spirochaetales bacterium]